MQSYDEKRDFPRMELDNRVRYWKNSDHKDSAIAVVKNLSGNGLLLYVDKPLELEEEISVEIKPKLKITPARTAIATVTRCQRLPEAQMGEYALACTISEFLEPE